jgi:hypothetical protein
MIRLSKKEKGEFSMKDFKMNKDMNLEMLKNKLQKSINWQAFFSIARDVFQDPGFQSNADNFARATLFEMALEKLSSWPCNVERIDEDGCDLLFHMNMSEHPLRVELKTKRDGLFYKKGSNDGSLGPGDTTAIEMKKKRGTTGPRTIERWKQEKTYDFLMVIQFEPAAIILAKDGDVRPLYYDAGACVKVNIPKSLFTRLDISVDDTLKRWNGLPMLSECIKETYEKYIMSHTDTY